MRLIDENKKKGNAAEADWLKAQCLATMVALRKLNRLDKHRLKATRDAVRENRSRVDNLHLQLQNLVYEVGYLRSEVEKCHEFKSMHEQIELVPLEEFLESAPDELRSGGVSEHEITMARLRHELALRRALATRLETSVSRKKCLIDDIEAKEKILLGVQPTLDNILEAAQPLYSHLGMTLQRNQPEHTNAAFLCRPLYIVYVEAAAFQEVYPNLVASVAIDGEPDDAKKILAKMQASGGAEDDSDSEAEELVAQVQVAKKRKRKSRTASRGGKANVEEQNQLKAFLRPFPLSVTITLKTPDEGQFPVRFSYVTSLRVVCCKLEVEHIAEVDSLLDGLYPGDSGLTSPNPTTHYLLAKNGVDNLERALSVCNLGKPYQWTQWLAGLDYLSSSASSSSLPTSQQPCADLSRRHFERTFRLIVDRLSTRVALSQQLAQLAEGQIVVDGANRFPQKVSSVLQRFVKITAEEAIMRIGFGTGTENVKEMMSKESLFFDVTITKDEKCLEALVAVPQSYPQEAPFWFFSFGGTTSLLNAGLRDLERTVNCFRVSMGLGIASDRENSQLLSLQAMQALVAFEVMLDVDQLRVARRTCGKDRAKPFNYEPSVGIFTPN
ncbi:THO complex subunit 5 homolog isoform X2 [Varroa jacobsoni]|nr:THO complex subunit 5 homolog isoform X2 [Varroa destructor]XP_022711480.1 THO complex subunit 5 homolog isoform X2 [Varroa jacobsoni]